MLLFGQETYRIRAAVFDVYHQLGPRHAEAVFEEALKIALRNHDVPFQEQVCFEVLYADTKVGRYRPDILACDKILLELKAVEALLPIHEAQVLSYLRVAGLPLALLINFGASDVQVERRILTGDVQRREPPERNRPYPGGLERLPHPELLWAIGNCVRRVHFTIGTGFLFHIYENALAVEMGIQGVPYERVKYLPVSFDGEVVGQDRVHLLVVGGRVLVVPLTVGTIGPTERKAARKRLLALGIELALLVNFHDTSAVTQVVQV